jgi:hypothetical protein
MLQLKKSKVKNNNMLISDTGCTCIAGNCIWLYRLPHHKNNVYMFSKVYCYLCGKEKFLAVRRVGLMTHGEYRVDRSFPVT